MYDDNAFEEFVQEKLSCGEIRPRDNIPVTTFGRGTTTTAGTWRWCSEQQENGLVPAEQICGEETGQWVDSLADPS